jgi:hypothetical protein
MNITMLEPDFSSMLYCCTVLRWSIVCSMHVANIGVAVWQLAASPISCGKQELQQFVESGVDNSILVLTSLLCIYGIMYIRVSLLYYLSTLSLLFIVYCTSSIVIEVMMYTSTPTRPLNLHAQQVLQ